MLASLISAAFFLSSTPSNITGQTRPLHHHISLMCRGTRYIIIYMLLDRLHLMMILTSLKLFLSASLTWSSALWLVGVAAFWLVGLSLIVPFPT